MKSRRLLKNIAEFRFEFYAKKLWRFPCIAILLYPLSSLYRLVFLFLKTIQSPKTLPVTLVVFGNAVVGGSGKTPMVIHFVHKFKAMGYNVAVLVKGYKREFHSDKPLVFYKEYPFEFLGDEGALIGLETHVPVAVGSDRLATAEFLLQQHPEINLLISDDGLQFFKWKPDVKVALLGKSDVVQNGALLPAGPLREPLNDLKHYDFILSSDCQEPGYTKTLSLNLFSPAHSSSIELTSLKGQQVSLLTGIACPEELHASLSSYIQVDLYPYPDHETISLGQLSWCLLKGPVIVTLKDFIKIKHLTDVVNDLNFYVVLCDLVVHPDVESRIINFVKMKIQSKEIDNPKISQGV